jgi:hypothetical protein
MATVPIEYLVIAFPDGNISEEIAPELADLVDKDFGASELDPGCAAAVLLLEDLWAAPLASALDRSGGVLLEGARIPQDLLTAEIAQLAAAS